MKKIAILLLALTVNIAYAQKSAIRTASSNLSLGKLDKAKAAIDQAIVHEDTKNLAKTWYVCGKVYQAIAEDQTDIFKLDPDKTALQTAYDAYMKQMELAKLPNKKGKVKKNKKKKEIIERLRTAKPWFINYGIDGFNTKDFPAALRAFEYAIKISEIPEINVVDTAVIYNAAVAADNAKDYPKAIKYYSKITKLRYRDANVYYFLANAYMANKDTVGGVNALKEGITAWPESNSVLLVQLVNHFLRTDKTDEALTYLQKAIEKDPKNETFQFVLGTLYEKTAQEDLAIAAYNKAIELKPDYFDPNYNLGVIYFNKTVPIYKEADGIPLNQSKKYDAKVAEAVAFFKKSLPYVKKAYEINPDDVSTKQTLKNIYIRLKMKKEADALN